MRRRRRWALGGAVAVGIGLVAVAVAAGGQGANANEFGDSLGQDVQVSPTAWRMTSPSGLSAVVDTTDLLAGSGASNTVVANQARAIHFREQLPPVSSQAEGVAAGVGGTPSGVYAFPKGWTGDQKWHPAARITIRFDHPVVNPSLPIANYLVTAADYVNGVKVGAGTTAMQLEFESAAGPSGNVDVSVNPSRTFNTHLYDVQDNVVTPKLVDGLIPYMSGYTIYCLPHEPSTTDPATSPFTNKLMKELKGKDPSFISGPCGTLQVDTKGQAISELVVRQDLSYLSATDEAPDYRWNGSAAMQTVFDFSALTEVSGSETPTTFDAATHAVSTLAIGTPGDTPTIAPAFREKNLSAATAGTSTDNSDAGYTADSSLVHAQLTDRSSGTFTVQVPYTGLSQAAYLNGWIDFNQNGTWDPGESANSVATIASDGGADQSGTATLSFTLPSAQLAPTDAMWMRLRLAYDASDVASPAGMARSGEVEDHTLSVLDTTPELKVSKKATVVGEEVPVINSVIRYDVTVRNLSGSEAADDVTIKDTIPAGIAIDLNHVGTTQGLSYTAPTLTSSPVRVPAGGEVTITYFGTATDVGTQRNVVIAETPHGCQTSDQPGNRCESSSETDIQPTGALQLTKTTPGRADDDVVELGEKVTYLFTVTNATPNPAKDIVLTDPMLGSAMCQLDPPTLGAGASGSCEVEYTVTQADVDAGRIVNLATVAGKDSDGDPVPGDESTKTNDTWGETGSLVIEKSSTLPGGKMTAALDDAVSYQITATNTSGYTMNSVTISDPKLSNLACSVGGISITFPYDGLAPGGEIDCTGTHTVTAGDVSAGHVANLATGEADLPPAPDTPNTPRPADVTPGQDDVPVGGLVVTKKALLNGVVITNEKVKLGDQVKYEITVANSSAYPITNVELEDRMLDIAGVTVTCQPGRLTTLNHGESFTCSGKYTVTQADIDRGHVANTATANGQWPADPDFPGMPVGPVPPASDSTDTPTQHNAGSLEVSKTAKILDKATKAVKQSAAAGDSIQYTITARNTGGLTMTDVEISDPLLPQLGTAGALCATDVPAATNVTVPATLQPGSTLTCTGTYVVTAADAAAGKVANVATAAGQVPGPWDPQDPDATVPPVPVNPDPAENTKPVGGLTVTKTESSPHTPAQLGDVIDYQVVVANTSAYPLHQVVLSDSLVTAGQLTMTCQGGDPFQGIDLGPHESVTCTGSHPVSASDIKAGRVLNTATAAGEWGPTPPADWAGPVVPSGDLPPAAETVVTPTALSGDGLVLTKDAVVNGGARKTARQGDTITFLITARNTSNQVMHSVVVRDPLLQAAGIALTCTPRLPVSSLAAGASIECRANYVVSAADVKRGSVLNTVTASGLFPPDAQNPDGRLVPVVDDSTRTPVVADPAATGKDGRKLVFTGAEVLGASLLGLALITAGLALLWARRRRS